jgi:hypothetical protein
MAGNAPYAAAGFSAGGGFASTLITMDPDRTIAAGIIKARYNFTAFLPPNPPPSAAVLAIPSVLITGEGKNPKPFSHSGISKSEVRTKTSAGRDFGCSDRI